MNTAHDGRFVFSQLLVVGQVVRHPDHIHSAGDHADHAQYDRRASAPDQDPQGVTPTQQLHLALIDGAQGLPAHTLLRPQMALLWRGLAVNPMTDADMRPDQRVLEAEAAFWAI